jgi:GNAT superfamily N-acetyltransferase
VKRELGDGFELDDDLDRVDLAAVHCYLSEESYWAKGREYGDVEILVREAARVVGLYHDGSQIGFCRAARCAPGLFYLADVYVLDDYRGRGLGVELVREMIDGEPLAGRKWLLHTEDAHDLYKRFGFAEPNYKLMERPAPSA